MDIKEYSNTANPKPGQEKVEINLRDVFQKLELDIEQINPGIVKRLELLQEVSQFLSDEYRAINLAKTIFDYYEHENPNHSFNEDEARTVMIGTLFTDIGKTGPADAVPAQQKIVAEIFNIENVQDPDTTLEQLVRNNFDDAPQRLEELGRIGIDPGMKMRDFWNKHAEWTYDIVSNDGVPAEAVAAAATHQLLEGINPRNIVGVDGRYSHDFGSNKRFDRVEKFVIILDKYDAFRRRLNLPHEKAVEMLRKLVGKTKYADDPEFKYLISDVEKILS